MYFLFNRTTLQVFVTYLTGGLYVHPLWFYKHKHDNRVRSTQNAFSLPFAAILVICAPSGEMQNYCTPHIIKEKIETICATIYCYLKCSVYDKLLKPWQSFWITLYFILLLSKNITTIRKELLRTLECTPSMYLDCVLLWPDDGCITAETCRLEVNYRVLF